MGRLPYVASHIDAADRICRIRTAAEYVAQDAFALSQIQYVQPVQQFELHPLADLVRRNRLSRDFHVLGVLR